MPEKNSNPFTKMLVGILELGLFGYAIVSSFVKGWGNPRYGVLLLHLVVVVALAALFRRSSARREKILWTVLLLAESLLLAPLLWPALRPGCGDARLVLARLLLVPVPVGLSFHPAHRFFPQTSRAARLNLHKPPLPCAD